MSKLIQHALDLQDGHLQMWKPFVTPRHRYLTRFEKKRIHTAISKRDNEFIKLHLSRAATLNGYADRIANSITVFSYLVNEPFLLQNQRFRTTLWGKMNEFEVIANREMVRIHAIRDRATYESFAVMRSKWEDLLHVIWHLRDVIRI